jgi:hypothetical protein
MYYALPREPVSGFLGLYPDSKIGLQLEAVPKLQLLEQLPWI